MNNLPKVELGTSFKDERGIIQNILSNQNISHIAIITSKKDSIRSQHYHKNNGGHFLYVQSGIIKYYERDLDGNNIKILILNENEMVFTGPNLVHKVEFMEDSVLLSMNINDRGPEHDKENTVQMEF